MKRKWMKVIVLAGAVVCMTTACASNSNHNPDWSHKRPYDNWNPFGDGTGGLRPPPHKPN